MVYVLVIVPLQLLPTNGPSTELTNKFACCVQLSFALAQTNDKKPAIVVLAGGRSPLHSRSTVVGGTAVGLVLSVTVNTWFTVVALPHPSVIVYVLVMLPLQLPFTNGPSTKLTRRSTCGVQLSFAFAPVNDKKPSIVILPAVISLLHSS